jgi:hypothetical protein
MKKHKYVINGKGNFYNKENNDYLETIEYNSKIDQYCINGQWELPFHKSLYDYKSELRNILLYFINFKKKYENNITNDIVLNKINNIINDIKKITIEI